MSECVGNFIQTAGRETFQYFENQTNSQGEVKGPKFNLGIYSKFPSRQKKLKQ